MHFVASGFFGASFFFCFFVGGGLSGSFFFAVLFLSGGLLASRATMCRSTASVIARDEYCDDGEGVVPEFRLGGLELSDSFLSSWRLVVNHEFAPGTLKHVLDEVESKSTEPISVGHHNLFDVAAQDSVQKGREAGALPVDARGDVLDDLVVRVRFSEELDLSL
jgi:hypothetical protein